MGKVRVITARLIAWMRNRASLVASWVYLGIYKTNMTGKRICRKNQFNIFPQ